MSQTQPFRFTSYVPTFQPSRYVYRSKQKKIVAKPVLLANTDGSDCKSEEFTFGLSEKRNANTRNLKLPNFEQLNEVSKELSTLQFEIFQQKKEMDALQQKQCKLQQTQKEIRDDIKKWHSQWRLWNSQDFVQWIFQLDGCYFDFKHNVNGQKFDKDKFEFALDSIVNRIQQQQQQQNMGNSGGAAVAYNHQFEGKYLVFFDVLDVKQLFDASPLDADDCRKLFHEIQKLIQSENEEPTINPNFAPFVTRNQKTLQWNAGICCARNVW
eukprot:CAMPEP_0202692940 /NCGR_PEP_ID=MMETSP1385-20130828/7187_1 /ASSEMBLY_ACC=CAM_ASM_000861 /TAXON_ID=933848 /ORGANISM="Elphidium margaritaceum" /LENGTH=267 /DNA_ID=CAMNT_0049348549 /DNA_START=26 /DNA_END=827 /DNA_ORIENTATION=-